MADAPVDRLDEVRDAIRSRLRPVCVDWPREAFEAMVERLALVTLKYEMLGSGNAYDRRTTDRLLAEIKDVLEQGPARNAADSVDK